MSKQPRKSTPKPADPALDAEVAALSYEEAIEELESIIERMEKGETALEDSLREYARGDALDDASERAGVLRDFLPAFGGVGLRAHVEGFKFRA